MPFAVLCFGGVVLAWAAAFPMSLLGLLLLVAGRTHPICNVARRFSATWGEYQEVASLPGECEKWVG